MLSEQTIDILTWSLFCVMIGVILCAVVIMYESVFEYREMRNACEEAGMLPLANGSVEPIETLEPWYNQIKAVKDPPT